MHTNNRFPDVENEIENSRNCTPDCFLMARLFEDFEQFEQ